MGVVAKTAAIACVTLAIAGCGGTKPYMVSDKDNEIAATSATQQLVQERLIEHYGVEAKNPDELQSAGYGGGVVTSQLLVSVGGGKPAPCAIRVKGNATVVGVSCGGEKVGALAARNQQTVAGVLARFWALRPVNVDDLPDRDWSSRAGIDMITPDKQVLSCRVGVLEDFTSLRVVCKESSMRFMPQVKR